MFRLWASEIVCIILAIGLVGAITIILSTYNGSPVPDWGSSINLNALLALLSTILRAVLVVIVSQIISQRKWDWFGRKQPRPLSNLQQFDAGSRGVVGALQLIRTVLWKDPVTFVSAMVLLVSFLVGPFVQQANRTIGCTFRSASNVSDATVPFAHFVPRKGGFYINKPSSDLILAVLSSATSPEGTENKITLSCSTGNCTFPHGDPLDAHGEISNEPPLTTHSTVGVCSKCVDIGSLITQEKVHGDLGDCTDHILPEGDSVAGCNGTFFDIPALIRPSQTLEWMQNKFDAEIRAASRWAYVNVTFLMVQKDSTSLASTCILYPCLRTYTVEIKNNKLFETPVDEDIMEIDGGDDTDFFIEKNRLESANSRTNHYFNYIAVKSRCEAKDYDYAPSENTSNPSAPTPLNLYNFTGSGDLTPYQYTFRNVSASEHCIYRQNASFVRAIADVFATELFNGTCVNYGYTKLTCPKTENFEATLWNDSGATVGDMGVSSVMMALYNDGNNTNSNITQWFNSFANAMTSKFRSQYGSARAPWNISDSDALPLDVIHGIALQTNICVSLRWEWLLLPMGLTLITTILAVWTIITNWRQRHCSPVWKDSILPLLFYSHKFQTNDQPTLLTSGLSQTDSRVGNEDHVLEASALYQKSCEIMVRCSWSGAGAEDAEQEIRTSAATSQQELIPLRSRGEQRPEESSLPASH
jgi:hypothetical protein